MDNFFRVVKEKTSISTILEIEAKEVIPVSGATILVAADVKTVEVKEGAVLKIGEQYFMWNAEKKTLVPQIWGRIKKKQYFSCFFFLCFLEKYIN